MPRFAVESGAAQLQDSRIDLPIRVLKASHHHEALGFHARYNWSSTVCGHTVQTALSLSELH